MKKRFFFPAILVFFFCRYPSLFAQDKGVTPVVVESPEKAGRTTRAVVIGISDYQDPSIPDLQYADRDAAAFAEWLKSPAGGSLSDNDIQVLLNAEATTGKIIATLGWLIESSQKGDRAIIYFSGHGDVERISKFQRGYLLTWDSPSVVYAAGAFSISYLQDIINTLSEAGVQTILITDACRAGKLAGSEYGGTQATAEALSKQFANEIKILSCQPNEFSLEGRQWGGGRGVFSYHLIDGLYGMADANDDGMVSLLEIGRYLEDKVPAEAAPHAQIPFTVGNRAARVATVNPMALAERIEHQKGTSTDFQKIGSKGLEDLLLSKSDSSIQTLYRDFLAALERGDLITSTDSKQKSADELYKILINEPSIAGLHGLMTRNFAAALMDDGQQVLNKLLKTDPVVVDEFWFSDFKRFDLIAKQLSRATELLGPKHYVYKSLKNKELFFLSYTYRTSNYPGLSRDTLRQMKKAALRRALEFDENTAYVWWRLSQFAPWDSLEFYNSKITEISPRWALWYYDLGNRYFNSNYDASRMYLKKAFEADSTFIPSYASIAWTYESVGQLREAQKWRTLFVEKTQDRYKGNLEILSPAELNALGNMLWRLSRYREAEQVLWTCWEKSGHRIGIGNLSALYPDMGRAHFQRILDSLTVYHYPDDYYTGQTLYLFGDSIGADTQLRLAIKSYRRWEDPFSEAICIVNLEWLHRHNGDKAAELEELFNACPDRSPHFLFWKAEFLSRIGKHEAAAQLYDSLLQITNTKNIDFGATGVPDSLWYHIAQYRLGRGTGGFDKSTPPDPTDPFFYFNQACLFAQTGNAPEAMRQLELAEKAGWQPVPFCWVYRTAKDPFLDPLRALPAFQAWEKRWLPPYKDYSKN